MNECTFAVAQLCVLKTNTDSYVLNHNLPSILNVFSCLIKSTGLVNSTILNAHDAETSLQIYFELEIRPCGLGSRIQNRLNGG